MPFSDEFVDTFKAIRSAAKSTGLVAERVDHDEYLASDIVRKIKAAIRASTFVVVDVSGSRPSVLHEYGFAEAVPKPTIAITSTPLSDLPFNVRNNTTRDYVRGNIAPLRTYLRKAFREELKKLP